MLDGQFKGTNCAAAQSMQAADEDAPKAVEYESEPQPTHHPGVLTPRAEEYVPA